MIKNIHLEFVKQEFSRARSYASEYQGVTPMSHFFNIRIQRVYELLNEFKIGKVLDVGCGPGIVGNIFRCRPIEYYGVDVSEKMIKECINTFGNHRQFRFSIGKIEELPFYESCFDVVLCLGAFEYVVDGHIAVSEIVRVLKTKGIVIITMLNGMSPYRIWQKFLYWKIMNVKNNLKIIITDGNNSQGEKRPDVTLYKEKDLRKLLVSHGLEVEDTLYYDYNLFFPPLDALFPETSVLLSSKLEFLCRSKLKYMGTGFILKCRKK